MIAKPRFSGQILATLRESKGLRIRAGNGTHRFIGIWVVVVNDRVFVRSWSLTPGRLVPYVSRRASGVYPNRRSRDPDPRSAHAKRGFEERG